jgi:hypothetical protein
MKAASVLFGCVSAAGNAQEEDEVCKDILQRNVVLITPFGSSGIPPLYLQLSMRWAINTNQVPAVALQSFPGHHYPANLGAIIYIPLFSL